MSVDELSFNHYYRHWDQLISTLPVRVLFQFMFPGVTPSHYGCVDTFFCKTPTLNWQTLHIYLNNKATLHTKQTVTSFRLSQEKN